MRVTDIALAPREGDDDIAMFIRTDKNKDCSFVIPRELLPDLLKSVERETPLRSSSMPCLWRV